MILYVSCKNLSFAVCSSSTGGTVEAYRDSSTLCPRCCTGTKDIPAPKNSCWWWGRNLLTISLLSFCESFLICLYIEQYRFWALQSSDRSELWEFSKETSASSSFLEELFLHPFLKKEDRNQLQNRDSKNILSFLRWQHHFRSVHSVGENPFLERKGFKLMMVYCAVCHENLGTLRWKVSQNGCMQLHFIWFCPEEANN